MWHFFYFFCLYALILQILFRCLQQKTDEQVLTKKKRIMKSSWKKSMTAMVMVALAAFGTVVSAQDSKGSFSVGADVVSSYVWRGMPQELYDDGTPTKQSPNIQPYASYTIGGLTIGAWGSTSFISSIKEFDLYATYALSSKLAVTLTDYNWNFSKDYFKYAGSTDHIYEATLAYTGDETLPLSLAANVMLGGADKKDNGDQAYSTYVEAGYQVAGNAKIFVGGSVLDTPMYGGAGVTNAGIKVTKAIEFSDKFSLPVYGIAGFNPNADNAFLVIGVSL
jgi:hypothetical protein